jgi:peptidyl-prolyl cis-trans isomerase C
MTHPVRFSALAALLLLVACGEKPASTSTAAIKVNGEAINRAEVEGKIQQYQHLPAAQRAAVSEKILASLADSELLRQAAVRDKLDQDEAVQTRLISTNRLILASVYIEKIKGAVAQPSEAEVKAYFERHPERYAERKTYELWEVVAEGSPENLAKAEAKLAAPIKHADFTRWMNETGIPFNEQHLVASADKVLAPVLAKLRTARPGDVISLPGKSRLSVLFVNAVHADPLAWEQAAPMIAETLLEERKTAAMEAMLKKLRDTAKVEYLPPYSGGKPVSN